MLRAPIRYQMMIFSRENLVFRTHIASSQSTKMISEHEAFVQAYHHHNLRVTSHKNDCCRLQPSAQRAGRMMIQRNKMKFNEDSCYNPSLRNAPTIALERLDEW